jgi:hypothetical protein
MYLSTLYIFTLKECGSNFTYKLEGMFNDLETSKILMTSFVKVFFI